MTCLNCGESTTSAAGYCSRTRKCKTLKQRVRYSGTAERPKCARCESEILLGQAHGYCGDCLRPAVLEHYGPDCACCHSTENLCVDHINGDGREHRAEVGCGEDPRGMCRWLIRNNFPPGFQVLCHPCNNSKGRGTTCAFHSKNLGPDMHREIPGQLALFDWV